MDNAEEKSLTIRTVDAIHQEIAVLRSEVLILKTNFRASEEKMNMARGYEMAALKLQAAEYERRLELLNHEHARLDKMQQGYVPREVYDAALKEWGNWRGTVDIVIADIKGRIMATAGILAILFALAQFLMRFWK